MRAQKTPAEPSRAEPLDSQTLQAQARYVSAALLLNATQLGAVLRVSRSEARAVLDGEAPPEEDAQRLARVRALLGTEGVTPQRPLASRYVRRALPQRERALLDVLAEETLCEDEARALVRQARELTERARARHTDSIGAPDANAVERRLHNMRVVAWCWGRRTS